MEAEYTYTYTHTYAHIYKHKSVHTYQGRDDHAPRVRGEGMRPQQEQGGEEQGEEEVLP